MRAEEREAISREFKSTSLFLLLWLGSVWTPPLEALGGVALAHRKGKRERGALLGCPALFRWLKKKKEKKARVGVARRERVEAAEPRAPRAGLFGKGQSNGKKSRGRASKQERACVLARLGPALRRPLRGFPLMALLLSGYCGCCGPKYLAASRADRKRAGAED